MDMIGQILGFVAAFVVGWIGLGSAVSYIRLALQGYKPLSLDLVAHGIYNEKTHKTIMTNALTGTIIMGLISCGILLALSFTASSMTWLMALIGLGLGLFKGRNLLDNKQLVLHRFFKSYLVYMDKEKAEKYYDEVSK